ncbi:heterokaryon incompatibility protein-domain-containing protein [Stachybotrys elegans]|uniref:Heterokaryon incompatibility protein-domain-containing protein n=1 Tax=Stachybotrys elegans TaxID=80388 RepID=A0A8K0S7V1_9HYPO|nr:heterokaryon incompatibility protein-domain-containing protein [Stachybotrys elegans]
MMAELCDRCEATFSYARQVFAQPVLADRCSFGFSSYQALEQNAENSTCRLCRIVFSCRRQDEIQRIVDGGNLDQLRCTFDFFDENRECLLMDVFTPRHTDAKIFGSKVRFRRSGRGGTDFSTVERSTWSWRSLGLVRGWLSKCSSLHEECSTLSAAGRLPLRFLDIDPENEIPQLQYKLDESHDIELLSLKRMPNVKLCLTADLPLKTQYLTLSHCWGRSPVTKLTNQNLEEYCQSIPSDVLERPTAATFRQAIHVARCLSFRYLWIDALCINQEDENEKDEEISYMDQIYTHATLNLSATAAHDGSGGLFFERGPETVDVCHSQQHPGIVAFLHPSHSFVHEVVKSPINKRAWVFQERMLATRVLHFCRSRLIWECCNLQEAEPLSEDIPTSVVAHPRQTKQLVLPHQRDLTAERARLRWANALERYSEASLSFRGDTLLALSAIAATLCRQRGLQPQDYAAGLWVADLPLSLRWRVARQPDRTAAEYIAPSWSWAALFCPIDVQRDAYVRVFADHFVPSIHLKREIAPFGSVMGGSLRLRGMLTSLCYLESEDCFRMGLSDNQAPTVVSSGFPGTIRDGLPDKVYKRSKKGQISRFVQESSQSYDLPFDESDVLICEWDNGIPGHPQTPQAIRFPLSGGNFLEVQDGSFFLLPLGQRKKESSDNEGEKEQSEADDRRGLFDRIEGLILHRTLAKGEYIRVGLFTTHCSMPLTKMKTS